MTDEWAWRCTACGEGTDNTLTHVCPEDHDTPADEAAPPKASCGGCRFYSRDPDAIRPGKGLTQADTGLCCIDPPRLIDSEGYGIWPRVGKTRVCGQFDWREEPESEYARDHRERSEKFERMLDRHLGPALPPRECPCDGHKLRPGQKAHLIGCALQHLGSEEGYSRSLAGFPHECREPGCETLAVKSSMLCGPHGGVPLAERLPQVTGKLTV